MNENKDIHELIDDIVLAQSNWTKEERLRYFASTFYPKPIDFIQEVDGTKYIVRTFFDKDAHTLRSRFERLIKNNSADLSTETQGDIITAEYVSAANPISDRKEQNAEENSSQTE